MRKNKNNLIADKFIKKGHEKQDNTKENKIIALFPQDKYIDWYANTYLNSFIFNKLPNINKAEINIKNTALIRLQNISIMKYQYNYNSMDTIVVVMKLYEIPTRKETIFGTLFCQLITPEISRDYEKVGGVAFTYFSATPSYISCDGEYRSQFSRYRSLYKTKRDFPEIWNEIEQYIIRIIIRRQWSVYSSYFYPKLEESNKNTEVEYAIKYESINNGILLASWYNTIYEEMCTITKTHVNQLYKDIFLKNAKMDIDFLKELINKYGVEKMESFRMSLFDLHENFDENKKYLHCGYKMIPLNIKEVQDPLKIKYKPWREFLISNRCNDLVINGIAPCVSITLDWFYIKNSKKGLFDNKSQYDRMKNSELAKEILRILYEAQRGTYFITMENSQTIRTSENIKKWINSKFKKLNEKIEDPINYSIEEIIMSEVTLAFANEYVGRTFADCITLSSKSKILDDRLGHPFKDVGYDYFAKYIFDICYGLYCINSKLGIMHGDFHLNNCTIGMIYNLNKENTENKGKLNKVIYIIDDEYQFVFPNNSYYGCLIDFSRCIINPHTIDLFVDKSLPSAYTLTDDREAFIINEINNLLNMYLQLFPNRINQKEELVVLLKNHYDATFRLLTCMDIYMFSYKLEKMLLDVKNVGIQCIKLVNKIFKLSEEYITTEMNYLIENPNEISKKILSDDYPMLTIIKKCFAEYIDGKTFKKIGIITDIYCYNNNLKYSLDVYNMYPEYLKFIKYEDDKHIVKELKLATQKRYEKYETIQKIKKRNLSMLNYIADRHKQKAI